MTIPVTETRNQLRNNKPKHKNQLNQRTLFLTDKVLINQFITDA